MYRALVEDIREQIQNGQLKPGSKLPSEPKMATERNCSRSVVRQAYQQLEAEGAIIGGQGRGWLVVAHKPLIWWASRLERNVRTDVSPADAWSVGVREQGREPTEKIAIEVCDAPRRIAERLELPAEQPVVVVRKRWRYVDGILYALSDSYYPEHLVRDTPIARPGDVLPGTHAVMANLGLGWDDGRSIDDLEPCNATHDIADLFGIAVGNAMFEHIRTRYTESDRPVVVTVTTAPRGRVVIRYEGKSWPQQPNA